MKKAGRLECRGQAGLERECFENILHAFSEVEVSVETGGRFHFHACQFDAVLKCLQAYEVHDNTHTHWFCFAASWIV